MLFHCFDGNTKVLCHFCLRDFVDFMQDEHRLTARRQCGDRIDEQLKLTLGLVSVHGVAAVQGISGSSLAASTQAARRRSPR